MDQIPDFVTHLLVKCRTAILPFWTTNRLNSHASVKREQELRGSCCELTGYYIITRVRKLSTTLIKIRTSSKLTRLHERY
jgi:hypothetical protein